MGQVNMKSQNSKEEIPKKFQGDNWIHKTSKLCHKSSHVSSAKSDARRQYCESYEEEKIFST